jgi:hypothetical protein
MILKFSPALRERPKENEARGLRYEPPQAYGVPRPACAVECPGLCPYRLIA